MPFQSYVFLFAFLPLTVAGYYGCAKAFGYPRARWWLIAASLAFYAYYSVPALGLLLLSIGCNYGISVLMARHRARAGRLLALAVVANVAYLASFKYLNFAIDNLNALGHLSLAHVALIFPLGVSFYTFFQIAYLVEFRNAEAEPDGPGEYVLFAAFFAYVTAGPLVNRRDMLPQIAAGLAVAQPLAVRILVGLTALSFGLFSKLVLADGLAPSVNAVHAKLHAGGALAATDALYALAAYPLQLYFDFAGYSTIALGLAYMLGFRLPLNFNRPFRADSIIEYWRRWHMTMTRFFTNFVYTPLAVGLTRFALRARLPEGARFGLVVFLPTIFTFTVAGLWHGAGWTFVVFGLIHGVALALNHLWREYELPRLPKPLAWVLTMLTVTVALGFFRSASVGEALGLLRAAFGRAGGGESVAAGVVANPLLSFVLLAALLAGAIVLPTTQQLLGEYRLALDEVEPGALPFGRLRWAPSAGWIAATAVAFTLAVLSIGSTTEFLYYKF